MVRFGAPCATCLGGPHREWVPSFTDVGLPAGGSWRYRTFQPGCGCPQCADDANTENPFLWEH